LFFIHSAGCDGTVISISPASSTLPKSAIGTNFQVNISISDVANLWSWKVSLVWNPSVLDFTNITEGPFLMSGGSTLFLNAPTQSNGSLPEISDTLLENVSASGNGTLVTVNFNVTGSGQSDITLNDTVLLQPSTELTQSPIAHTEENGQVTVLGTEIPEFPPWAILIVGIVAVMCAAIFVKKRSKPKPHQKRTRP
ncbi:MAG TPA: cohesin domain-containing protein, partial [Candidatus Acidoferrum sp.]|nr:cohesin domain-containing protein [Candidatus Acidoferrum sp.]